MGRPGQDTDFLLEHVPQFGQVGAGVGVRDECDGEAAGLQAVRNISRSTGRVVGIEAREQFKEMTGTSATWWRRASAASPTRSASSTRSSKTPLNARSTAIGAVATGSERARIDGGKARTPPVKSRWPGTQGGRVPRPSIGNRVESGPDRSTQQLIHQDAAQSAPRPGSFPLQLGQMAVERSMLACRRAPLSR